MERSLNGWQTETLATIYHLRAGNLALTAAHSLVSGPDLRSLHRSAGEDISVTVPMLSARDVLLAQ